MTSKEDGNQCYRAGLYLRLSKDDREITGGNGESASIANQRSLLQDYAREHGFPVVEEYADDGWSGTTFERPAFQRMLRDIEAKKVNLVLVKDLSRLGRDYILAGQYTEVYFPSRKVRFIAVNDGVDSEGSHADIAPFKNVINEMYARDISKKIRSALAARMREGAFIGNFAPYGYRKDPLDKHHLVPDEKVAPIVRKMFHMAAKGEAPSQIAKALNLSGEPCPLDYRCGIQDGRGWSAGAVKKILGNLVYLGHMAQGKSTKISFKSQIVVNNPQDKWWIVENTHEPLITKEVFSLAARRSKNRTCHKTGVFTNLFSGIAKCADCGRNLSTVGTRKKGSPANLVCGGYKLYGKDICTNHFIDYNVLYQIVLQALREQAVLSQQEVEILSQELAGKMRKTRQGMDGIRESQALQKRNQELDEIIAKLYEDHAKGCLSGDRFGYLLTKYEREGDQVLQRLGRITQAEEISQEEIGEKQSRHINRLLRRYTGIPTLTPDVLFRFLERIEVGQGEYEKTSQGRIKRQTIKIYFRFGAKEKEATYRF